MSYELAAEFPGFVTVRGIPEATHETVGVVAANEILGSLADETKGQTTK